MKYRNESNIHDDSIFLVPPTDKQDISPTQTNALSKSSKLISYQKKNKSKKVKKNTL